MHNLILIGGTAVRDDGKNLYLKNTFSLYLNELAANFDYIYWFVSSDSTVECKTKIEIKNLKVIVYEKNFKSLFKLNLKLFYKLISQWKSNVLMFPTPVLIFMIPIIRFFSKRFISYIGVDYEQVIQSKKLRKNIMYKNTRIGIGIQPIWSWFFKHGHQLALSQSDCVIARGEYLQKFAKKFNSNVIITNPLSWLNLNEIISSPKKDSINLLFIGKLIKEKGIFNLLDSFRYLQKSYPDDNFHLSIVGDGQDYEKIQLYSKELKLNNVQFYGWIDNLKQIENFFYQASVLICPTLFGYPEGVPRVIDEALGFGVPVIASKVGGIQYEYIDGSVILFDSSKNNELNHALEDLLYNKETRDKLIKNMELRKLKTSKETAGFQHLQLFSGRW